MWWVVFPPMSRHSHIWVVCIFSITSSLLPSLAFAAASRPTHSQPPELINQRHCHLSSSITGTAISPPHAKIALFQLNWTFQSQFLPLKASSNLEACFQVLSSQCLRGGLSMQKTFESTRRFERKWSQWGLGDGNHLPQGGLSGLHLHPLCLYLFVRTLQSPWNLGERADEERWPAIFPPNQIFHKKNLVFTWYLCW